jgi:hypothetical protein
MIISIKIFFLVIKVCVSFILGVVLYKNNKFKKFLDLFLNLLFVIVFSFLLFLSNAYIIPYIYDSIIHYVSIEAASNTPATSGYNSSNSGGDAIIMTAALASGAKLAQKAPNIATKAAAIVSSVGLGARAIIVKNISGYMGSYIGKNS